MSEATRASAEGGAESNGDGGAPSNAEEEVETQHVLLEGQHAEQEASGLLRFHIVRNDGEAESLMTLIEVKNIYTMQLPKMGAEYIVRLVLKPDHSSLVCRHNGQVVGAITYRPHMTQTFAEIAFCCVSATHQVQGYGTRMMNQLKEQAKREGIEFLLTYADDHAVNYFKKQGFQKQVTMAMKRWKGYIKDYNGATMMECRIDKHIDYLGTRRLAAQQRQHILQKTLTLSNAHVVRPGLTSPAEPQAGDALLRAIPGLAETPWRPSTCTFELHGVPQSLEACLHAVYRAVSAESTAKPFEKPVAKADAPDYYEVIKDPLDLATIGQRLRRGFYATPQMFMGDISRMCENCKIYNGLDSSYSAQAERLESFTRARIAEIRRVIISRVFRVPGLRGRSRVGLGV